jgi:hypothetical protein
LGSVDELEWLSGVKNGSDMVLLPLGENGTAKIFRLGINEAKHYTRVHVKDRRLSRRFIVPVDPVSV